MLNVTASYEYQKNERIQQWNLCKCPTSTYCPNLFEHFCQFAIRRSDLEWETWLLRSLYQPLKQHIGQVSFINNTFSSASKLLTPNMYCWSCKTLVTIYWRILEWMTHGQSTSFRKEKMNTATSFYTMTLTIFKSQWLRRLFFLFRWNLVWVHLRVAELLNFRLVHCRPLDGLKLQCIATATFASLLLWPNFYW